MLCPTDTTGGGDQPVTGGGSSSGGAGVTPMYVCSDGITRVADPSMCPVTVTNAPAPTPEPTPTPSTNPWFIVAGIGALYLLFRDRD